MLSKDLIKRIATIFIVALFVISLFAYPIYALTETRAVDAENSNDTIYAYAGGGTAGNYTDLNSDDGATSYLDTFVETTWKYHDYDFQNFTTSVTVNSVTIYYKYSSTSYSDESIKPYALIGGTRYFGTQTGNVAVFTLYSYTWNTNPSTGLAWTQSDLNATKFGWGFYASNVGRRFYLTYAYLSIDYSATVPSVTTVAASSVTDVTATLNGNITSTGGSTITTRGFVYDTVSREAPGNVAPAASGYSTNWTEAGAFSTGTFSHGIAGLTSSTGYYFRACAQNSTGWAYGDELVFSTLGNPSITTQAATQVGATTARLNSYVAADGGSACTVSFAYATTVGGPYANYAAIVAAGTEVTATGTYTTGQSPYKDISSLTANTGYTYATKIVNATSTQYGSQLTFTTATGVSPPSDYKIIPGATTMSHSWTKGSGSTNTYIRGKTNSYPTSLSDGTLVYDGTSSSYQQTGLSIGTPYYYRVWGRSGSLYSSTNVTAWAVTIASASGTGTFTTPTTPSGWFAAPDYTKMSGLPIYGLVNWWGGVFSIPLGTTWFLLAMIISVIFGVAVYAISSKLPAAMGVTAGIVLLFGAAGIVPIWLSFPLMLLTVAVWAIGERM